MVDDFEPLMRLYAELHRDEPVELNERLRDIFLKILNNEELILLVGTDDGKVIGTCYLNIIPNLSRRASRYAIIENVVTTQVERNKGYGQAIIRAALEQAWTRGCYKVMLQTGSRRESTHNFYQSCGFLSGEKFAFVARPPA